MSDEDEEGAQKLAVLIGAMLVFATVCVGFSVSIFLLLNVGYLYGWLSDTSTLVLFLSFHLCQSQIELCSFVSG